MGSLLAIALFGFVLGMRHATDADHVVAVSTIVSRHRSVSSAALIGAFWGVGHTLTIVIVGAAIILFNTVIPPRLGLAMELSVGIMLVILGALNLTGVTRRLTERLTPLGGGHTHPHAHGDSVHDDIHEREPGRERYPQTTTPLNRRDGPFGGTVRPFGSYQILRPLLVGIVHGLAGSAAVALLVLATIRNPASAVAYLLIFGLGTIAGMMLITVALGIPYAYTSRRFAGLQSGLASASGLLSLVLGLIISFNTSIAGGLFTSHPHWTPH